MMNLGLLDEPDHFSSIVFPSINIQLSVLPERDVIESESAISVSESSIGSVSEEQTAASQLLDDESLSSSSSSSTTESISIPDEKLGESNTTTITTDSNSNLFSFDLGNYVDDMIITLIVVLSSVSIYLIIHYTLKRSADSLNIKERRIKGIDSLVKTILIVITAIIILFQFSTVSATVAGFISIGVGSIIGFSSRNTISNAIAGIILLSSRPFKLGDRA